MKLQNPTDIGRIVRQQRHVQGLAQAELAVLAHVSRSFVSELEGGKATLEIGKVLSVLHAVRCEVTAEVPDPLLTNSSLLDELLDGLRK
jgi:HTH-type transcriptional regulator / antitoxin HipB